MEFKKNMRDSGKGFGCIDRTMKEDVRDDFDYENAVLEVGEQVF